MSLINCSECNNQVSDQAIQCPTCGYPIKKIVIQEDVPFQPISKHKSNKGCFYLVFGLIGVLFIIYLFITIFSKDRPSEKEIMKRSGWSDEQIEEFNNNQAQINEAEKNAINLLKSSLKDPESYDEVEVKRFTDDLKGNDSNIRIQIIYRAKNSYGAYIQETKNFIYSNDGKTLLSTY